MTYYILAYVAYCLINYRACRWFLIATYQKHNYKYSDIFNNLMWSFTPVANVVYLVFAALNYCKDKKPPTWL